VQITHFKSNIVPDFTGTVTVYDNSGSTQTVAATNLVRPSDWNSAHAMAITLTGNTAGVSTVSGSNIIWSGGPNVTLSGTDGTVVFSAGAGGGGGVALSAGANSVSNGTVVFSNSNGLSFGLNGSTVTASHNGLTTQTVQTQSNIAGISAGANSVGTGTVVFSNSHNMSFGLNGQTITGSASYSQSTAPGAIAAGTQTATSGTIVFSDSNGISFGLSGSTRVTASHNGLTSQSNQNVTAGNGGFAFQTLSFSNVNGISFGTSAGSAITASHNALTSQSNQAFSAAGGSSAFQTLSFSNANGATFSNNAGQVQLSYTVPTQTNQTVGMYALGNTTQNSSTTLDARTLSLNGLGGVTVGYSNGSIQISGAQTVAQTNQTLGLYAVSNTTGQSSSSTFDARTLSFHGAGIASVGYSGGSVVISVPAGGGAGDGVVSLGMSTEGNTAGTTGTVSSGRYIMVGSGPISLSQSLNGQSGTLSILGPATSSLSATGLVSISTNGSTISIGAGPFSAYAVSNTTQSSSGTVDGRSLSFHGAGGVSVGVSAGSIVISGAAGGAGATLSGLTHWGPAAELVYGQHGAGTLHVAPIENMGAAFQFDRVIIPVQISNASNSSGSFTLSYGVGIYTNNAGTLSVLASTSGSTNFSGSGTVGSYSLYAGPRNLTIPWTTTITAANIWQGVWSRTTTGGAAGMTLNIGLVSQPNSNFSGILGVATNASYQTRLGFGIYGSSSTNVPSSVPISTIQGSQSIGLRVPAIMFASGTV
jgi:hypothetical protein